MMGVQDEISASQTGLQETHGFHKEAVGGSAAGGHSVWGTAGLAWPLTSIGERSTFIYSA